ncbi:MAG: SIS domain-containing protein [Angelakisella sp.]
MFTEKNIEHLAIYRSTITAEFEQIVAGVTAEAYQKAVDLILASRKNGGRVHITGIGKPAHIGGYIASLLSSTGTPTYELHGTEAVHGSSGQVLPGDVVIAISNSGETAELRATVSTLRKNGAVVIGVSGNDHSWLATNSNAHLFAGIQAEGGPLNRAPRASILAEVVVLQGLTVLLQSIADVTPAQYVSWHPGGALGQLRDNETK